MEMWRIEWKYGRRMLPRSWVGSYLFDLDFAKNKKGIDKLAYDFLILLRKFKKRIVKKKTVRPDPIKTSYGFQSWRSVSEGKGIVHIPWYGDKGWKRLILEVDPTNASYHFKINRKDCSKIISQNGRICLDLPEILDPKREITIECIQNKKWQLKCVAWEI
jgi:hypothetical protein